MNYIITKHPEFFSTIGKYNFCNLEDMILPQCIAIDTETTGLKPIIADIFAIQIGTGTNNYLIHCYDDNYHPTDVFPYIEDKVLVGQNLVFDLGFFYKYGFYPDNVKDIFLASKILYNGLKSYRHDFGSIFLRELDIYYDKTEQKNIYIAKLSTATAIEYCFNDVDKVLLMHAHLLKKIIEGNYLKTYILHCNYILALAYMESCGAPVSTNKWNKKIELDKQVLKNNKNTVIEYIYDKLPQFRDRQIDMFDNSKKISTKITSSKQMINIFKAFNINVVTDEFKESIAEDIIRKSSHEFVSTWLEYQSSNHDVTTFGANILEKLINSRIYSGFNPILDTARISTRRGDVNTLNLPANERTRECVEAFPGYKMIVSDYDGQETRVGADITKDYTMIKSVLEGADLHCAFARVLFPEIASLTDEEIMINHKDKRNKSKSPRFCFQFGGTGYTLAMDTGISIEEGMRIEKLYKELHAGIYEYGEEKLKESMERGYIESTMGFKLHLPYYDEFNTLSDIITNFSKPHWQLYSEGKKQFKAQEQHDERQKKLNKEDRVKYQIQNKIAFDFYLNNKGNVSKYFKLKAKYFRLCLNNPTQTTAAHQTKLAAIKLFRYIKKNNHLGKAKLCIIPHDEFVLEVQESLCEEYKEKLGYFMREAGDLFIKDSRIKMSADANIGDNWYKAK